jgi:hypothetical protein
LSALKPLGSLPPLSLWVTVIVCPDFGALESSSHRETSNDAHESSHPIASVTFLENSSPVMPVFPSDDLMPPEDEEPIDLKSISDDDINGIESHPVEHQASSSGRRRLSGPTSSSVLT